MARVNALTALEDIGFRLGTSSDLPAICDLRCEALRCDPDSFQATLERFQARTPAERQTWVDHITNELGALFLVSDGIRLVGMAGCRAEPPSAAWFWGLFVLPSHRGRNIATRLLHLVFDHCQRAGCNAIEADVAVGNAAATSLYRRLGFAVHETDRFLREGSTIREAKVTAPLPLLSSQACAGPVRAPSPILC